MWLARKGMTRMNGNQALGPYIYTFNYHENDRELCGMELRALFGKDPDSNLYMESDRRLDPSRSPFLSQRIDVLLSGDSPEEIIDQVPALELDGKTFKVVYVKSGIKRSYEEQRELERRVGARIRGTAEMRNPEITFALLSANDGWHLGRSVPSEAVWLEHKHKPQNYSTGLSTQLARSLVNIAVPYPDGKKVIDPCCGMGNVLIEALSMEIDIVGRDLNPLAIQGARTNLRHFGYPEVVEIGDMNDVEAKYDAAILDMPYNLCSVLSMEERLRMLGSLRRFCARSVIVSSEPLEDEIVRAGWTIADRCRVVKGAFIRRVWVCE